VAVYLFPIVVDSKSVWQYFVYGFMLNTPNHAGHDLADTACYKRYYGVTGAYWVITNINLTTSYQTSVKVSTLIYL